MSTEIFFFARILLVIVSIIIIVVLTKIKIDGRTGTEFYTIMMIFWASLIIVGAKPEILDSILDTTGIINRTQFLFSASLIIIVYLLYNQSRKSKKTSSNLFQVIRNIALSNFKKEIQNKPSTAELIIVIVAKDESKSLGKVIDEINKEEIPLSYDILVVNDGSSDNT